MSVLVRIFLLLIILRNQREKRFSNSSINQRHLLELCEVIYLRNRSSFMIWLTKISRGKYLFENDLSFPISSLAPLYINAMPLLYSYCDL
jgi:hypothetical protein